jgi:hypothetical protein
VILLTVVLFSGSAISFLVDLQLSDSKSLQVKHSGTVPLVQNDEQAVTAANTVLMPLRPSDDTNVTYVEAVDTCNWAYQGECINVRSGPGTEYPSIMKLRKGTVLRVEGVVRNNFRDWYKITFDEFVRYPERLGAELYVSRDAVRSFEMEAPHDLNKNLPYDENKRIIVDLSDQALYAYEGKKLFMMADVSTGLDGIPTPEGAYEIFRKTPSRYMQGPIPGQTTDEYDLPGVPWTMYFTGDGAAIHGTYWHDEFGFQHSHGCVNLPPDQARKLYDWAPLGTMVIIDA